MTTGVGTPRRIERAPAASSDSVSATTARPRTPRCGVVFLLLWLMSTAWALATPPFAAPDEAAHVARAASIVRGQLIGSPAAGVATRVRIPGTLVAGSPCFASHPDVPASCAPSPVRGPALVDTTTYEGRYPPLYYLIVGLPSLLWTSEAGLYMMRVLAAALCSAFLAAAVCVAMRAVRSRVLVLGAAVAISPMALYLAGSVNPSGLEISAGICLWVTGSALVLLRDVPCRSSTLGWAGASAVALAASRGIAPFWLLLIALVLAGAAGRQRVRDLRSRRPVRLWLWAVLLVSLASVVWAVAIGGLKVTPAPPTAHGWSETAILARSWDLTPARLQQMVGVMGAFDAIPWKVTYVAWFAATLSLVLLGLAASRLRMAMSIAAVVVLGIGAPILIEASHARNLGFVWQGRYTLPFIAGLPVLAGFAASTGWRVPRDVQGRLAAAVAVLLAVAQVGAFVRCLQRYVVGADGPLYFFGGPWKPPVPALLLVFAFVLLSAAYAWLVAGRPVPRSQRTSTGPRAGAAFVAGAASPSGAGAGGYPPGPPAAELASSRRRR
jgi:hypothetical protein